VQDTPAAQLPALFYFNIDRGSEDASGIGSTQITWGVQMTFELYSTERARCAEDLSALTIRMGEIEEALASESPECVESLRLELALASTRAESERLEARLVELEGSIVPR